MSLFYDSSTKWIELSISKTFNIQYCYKTKYCFRIYQDYPTQIYTNTFHTPCTIQHLCICILKSYICLSLAFEINCHQNVKPIKLL